MFLCKKPIYFLAIVWYNNTATLYSLVDRAQLVCRNNLLMEVYS